MSRDFKWLICSLNWQKCRTSEHSSCTGWLPVSLFLACLICLSLFRRGITISLSQYSSSDTTRLGTGLSLADGSGDFFDFAEVFLFGMTGFVKGRRDNDIWYHNLANCHMPTTKSCTFVGGRDATVALPA